MFKALHNKLRNVLILHLYIFYVKLYDIKSFMEEQFMEKTDSRPLICSVELCSDCFYNSGYIRIFDDGNIDGILTFDYFVIVPAVYEDCDSKTFLLLQLLTFDVMQNNFSVPSFYLFDSPIIEINSEQHTEYPAKSITGESYITFKIINEIKREDIINKICHIIDKVKEKLISP